MESDELAPILVRRGFTPERLAKARARHDSLDQLCGTEAAKGYDGWTWRFPDDPAESWRYCFNHTRLKRDAPPRDA